MALNWVTPAGNIANLLIGATASINIQAVDALLPDQPVTYELIGGSLPLGISLSTINIGGTTPVYIGSISGTPTYTNATDTYWTERTYNFIIRASAGGKTTDRNFQLLVSNTVNGDFYWVTPPGNIGTVPAGEFYQLPLQVIEAHGNPVTFSFVSGHLPVGMQITRSGILEGVPTFQNAVEVNGSQNYRFTIRATNSLGHVNDQGFSLTVTSVAGPIIEPTAGSPTNLGTYFDGSYFTKQLYVNELGSNVAVTWSTVGVLPPGLVLDKNGLISGFIQPSPVTGNFGPKGFDGDDYIGPTVSAGHFVAGTAYIINYTGDTDFTLVGASSNSKKTEFIATGSGAGSGNAFVSSEIAVTNSQRYSLGDTTGDKGPYDFDNINASVSYTFLVQVYDGANYDLQSYTITVLGRNGFTADNIAITSDNTFVTVDSYSTYTPVLLNASTKVLPLARGSSYYAYKFDGQDFQGDTLTYKLADVIGTFDCGAVGADNGFDYNGNDDLHTTGIGFDYADYKAEFGGGTSATSNLPGLTLDAATGWLYGQLTPESSSYTTYTFGVTVSKTRGGVTYTSIPAYFSLTVLGDINNVVNWTTPSDLGTISNGTVSELVLQATSPENKPLVYTVVDQPNTPARLPQGLTLLPSGKISGRVSFEAFSVDDYATTFDSDTLTIDRVYKFTVKVETSDRTASSIREFTIKLNVIDIQPYNNLYLQALPALDQRQIFNGVINNTEIFVPELIYRADDPWFGVARNIEMLFMPGLNADSFANYIDAITRNHWTKKYNFGNVKTAVVLDTTTYKPKYEVVYIEVLDPELNSNNHGPALELDLNNVIANPYIDINGDTYKIVYPNSTENMIDRLVANVGYYDQSSLPEWMTSNQPNPNNPNGFSNPLGFTKAVVLAYTVPVEGQPIGYSSNLIAYRLQNSGIDFNSIDFTVDRYLLDDYYSSNFNPGTKRYISGRETTFDETQATGANAIAATVNYAVSVPFAAINGRTLSYVIANGGIDDVSEFKDGETIIFAKQENFNNAGPYDGWVRYTDAFLGDDITTPTKEGYDSGGVGLYDSNTFIPGYLEKLQNNSLVNQRGGVWQINVVNDIITLTFVKEIELNQKIRIIGGSTYVGALLYYNGILNAGQSVPAYSILRTLPTAAGTKTTFNGDTTKFFSYRDSYYEPGAQDKYVKFPQYGVFN